MFIAQVQINLSRNWLFSFRVYNELRDVIITIARLIRLDDALCTSILARMSPGVCNTTEARAHCRYV